MRASMMRILAVTLGLAGCASYSNTELRLLVNFAAKEACSCVFVMQQTDEACLEYSRQFIPIGKVDINHQEQSVSAAQGLLWVGSAHFVDERFGCVLDDSTGP